MNPSKGDRNNTVATSEHPGSFNRNLSVVLTRAWGQRGYGAFREVSPAGHSGADSTTVRGEHDIAVARDPGGSDHFKLGVTVAIDNSLYLLACKGHACK